MNPDMPCPCCMCSGRKANPILDMAPPLAKEHPAKGVEIEYVADFPDADKYLKPLSQEEINQAKTANSPGQYSMTE